jgi:hypothetical protein
MGRWSRKIGRMLKQRNSTNSTGGDGGKGGFRPGILKSGKKMAWKNREKGTRRS